jgi:hypothetical protein
MKVRFTDRDLMLFASVAAHAAFTRPEPNVIDSSGPPRGVLSGPQHAEPVRDFSSMSRQQRRYQERQEKKRA